MPGNESIEKPSGGDIFTPSYTAGVAPSVPIKPGEVEKADQSSLQPSEAPRPIKTIAEPSQPLLTHPRPFSTQEPLFSSLSPEVEKMLEEFGPIGGLGTLFSMLKNVEKNEESAPAETKIATVEGKRATEGSTQVLNGQKMLNNGLESMELLNDVIKETLLKGNLYKKNDPNNNFPAVLNFLETMGKYIAKSRAVQEEVLVTQRKGDEDYMIAQQAVQKMTRETTEKNMDKMMESAKLSLALKILSPAIIAISALATIITVGAASSTLVLAITLVTTGASIGLTVADSATGFMSQSISKMMSFIPDSMPGAEALRAAIIIAVIVVLAVAARGASAGIASSRAVSSVISAQVEKQVASGAIAQAEKAAVMAAEKEATSFALKQARYSLITTLLGTSGAIQGFVNGIGKLFPQSGADSETARQVTGVIVQMAVIMALVAFGGRGVSTAMMHTASKTSERIVSVLQAGLRVIAMLSQGSGAIIHGYQADTTLKKTDYEVALLNFNEMEKQLRESISHSSEKLKGVNEAVKTLMDTFSRLKRDQVQMASALSQAG